MVAVAYDHLVDNKTLYDIQYGIMQLFSIATKAVMVLFIVGAFDAKPELFTKINAVIKVFIGVFLIYRFNGWRQHAIRFTDLDRKMGSSAGWYIIFLSFADVMDTYLTQLRALVRPWAKPVVDTVKQQTTGLQQNAPAAGTATRAP